MASSFGFRLPSPGTGGRGFAARSRQGQRGQRLRSASDAAASSPQPQQGLLSNPVLKSGLICGALSLAGDVVAQLLTSRGSAGSQGGASGPAYDVARAARMGTFGLAFYGPFQYFWYGALDRAFPGRAVAPFLAKVSLNQLALAPITVSMAFAWNLALQGKLAGFADKCRADWFATLKTGWRFWIPAASINFFFMPLQYQVLYMSTCGMCWTGYLSFANAKKVA